MFIDSEEDSRKSANNALAVVREGRQVHPPGRAVLAGPLMTLLRRISRKEPSLPAFLFGKDMSLFSVILGRSCSVCNEIPTSVLEGRLQLTIKSSNYLVWFYATKIL